MKTSSLKVDLHVHSKASKRPSQWVLQKIGCPESFTEPLQLYQIAKERGMSFVTITDHNSIACALEIAHLPDTFVSEEITTYFPDERCKVHVLAFDITERQHEEIQHIRENIFDLVPYLREEQIHHAVAHPLFSVNDRLTVPLFEKLLLLFKNFELNGARDEEQNDLLKVVLARLTSADVEILKNRHNLDTPYDTPWRKNLIAGSDDHSSFNIARTFTEVRGATDIRTFLEGIETRDARPVGRASSPLSLAHNLYSIAYQFYKSRLGLEKHIGKDLFLKFLDGFLNERRDAESGLFSRIHLYISSKKRTKPYDASEKNILEILRYETRSLIDGNPEFNSVLGKAKEIPAIENKWFNFVNHVSNKVLYHFSTHLYDHLSGANFFNIFHTLGSAGGLYTLLAPYFVSFALFSQGRKFNRDVTRHFLNDGDSSPVPTGVRMAHFTDTFYEINGVASTLRQSADVAERLGKDLAILTCERDKPSELKCVKNFTPISVYELPEYPEQKLYCPPFLEMLNHCYEAGFTHIHSATPGPVGLAALAIARILGLPIYGTYHTALPQYAWALTEDPAVEELVWKYTLWYYDQMDAIFVPSRSTFQELAAKGIAPEKIRLFPRGIDTVRFHPAKRNAVLDKEVSPSKALRLLYVGRISREKNLPVLERAFKSLVSRLKDPSSIHLVVVGDGPYLAEMKQHLRGLPCTFTGYQQGEALPAIYASCDLFVFPSTTDTFGNVVLEAQASGLPVVVTDKGGPCENMLPGETGLVVPPDDPDSIVEAILALMHDPIRSRQMGRAARRYMENRSFETAFAETWGLYGGDVPEPESPFARAV